MDREMRIETKQKDEIPLPAPLFRDPIYDCPTDPTVIWNREEEQWYLFYTQRRAMDAARSEERRVGKECL